VAATRRGKTYTPRRCITRMGEFKGGTIVMRVRDPQPDPPPLAEHLPLVSARGPPDQSIPRQHAGDGPADAVILKLSGPEFRGVKPQRPSWEISAAWPPLRNGPGDHKPLRTSVPVLSTGASASGTRGRMTVSLPQSVSQFSLR
jgi:hypothetical protein